MERQYVAIDPHKLRSLIVREDEGGNELGVVRIDNNPTALAAVMAEAGPAPQVPRHRESDTKGGRAGVC